MMSTRSVTTITPQAVLLDAEGSATSTLILATNLQSIIGTLMRGEPLAVTFEQIEATMLAVGQDPFDTSELYQLIIDTLEQRQILVVETLADDQPLVDADAAANELADEVWDMLKRARLPLDEYRHPILSADRERRLLEIYHDGKHAEAELAGTLSRIQRFSAERRQEAASQALDELMRCNLRLVTKTAVRTARYTSHLDLDDLIQEGRIGLFKAIERFDLSVNLRLSTYAIWWIRQSIDRAVGDNERTIRLPIHAQEALRRLHHEREQWLARTGAEPSPKELADALGFSMKKLHLLCEAQQRILSLNMPVGTTGDAVLGELVADTRQYEPSRVFEQHALQATLQHLLDELGERERRVVQLRFGLLDGHERTLESVGREYGLTRERIRQIEGKALKRLQHPRVKRALGDFLG